MGSPSSRSIEVTVSVIAIQIEPHRVTRMFFDCCNDAADPLDQRHIELAIEHSIAHADPEGQVPEFLLMVA
jgi:hypothetical protein